MPEEWAAPERSGWVASMNAVIIYDELSVAANTNAMLEAAARRVGDTLEWTVKPWRLDTLLSAPGAQAALEAAGEAHLIVLALRSQWDLPHSFLRWLDAWAEHRKVQDATLAVLDSDHGDSLSPPAAPELSDFAERHNLSFIFDDRISALPAGAVLSGDRRDGSIAWAPETERLREQAVGAHSQSHWGINE